MISAKQKAKELYDFFYNMFKYGRYPPSIVIEYSKRAALEVVKNILSDMGADRGFQYWTKVKDEIELI
ncbi:MAG: hypothetical protein WCP46_00155 [Alphaproteobacteria bacterium]